MGFRVQDGLGARAREGLVGQRTPQEARDRGRNLVGGPSETWVLDVAGLGQGGGGGLPHVLARPFTRCLGVLVQLGELELKEGILVAGEDTEEDPVGQLERPALAGVPELEEAAVLRDGPDLLEALLGRGGQGHEVAAPGAIALLLPGDGLRRFRLDDGGFVGYEGFGRRREGVVRELAIGAEPDGFAAVLKQPGNRHAMGVGQVQRHLPVEFLAGSSGPK